MYGPILCEKSCFSIIRQLKGAMEKLQSNKSLWRTRTTFEFFSSHNLIIVFCALSTTANVGRGKNLRVIQRNLIFFLIMKNQGVAQILKFQACFRSIKPHKFLHYLIYHAAGLVVVQVTARKIANISGVSQFTHFVCIQQNVFLEAIVPKFFFFIFCCSVDNPLTGEEYDRTDLIFY